MSKYLNIFNNQEVIAQKLRAVATFALMFALVATGVPFHYAEAGVVVKPQPTTRTVFKSSGTFTVPYNVSNVDVLVVAGGGGGSSGGGGAGGLIYKPSFRVTPGSSIAVTVGDGGAGTVSNGGSAGVSGSNSIFSTITAAGGGGGGAQNANGVAGGSGSGAGADGASGYVGGAGNTPSVSPAQGTSGGNTGSTASPYPAAGGGGAGQAGSSGAAGAIAGKGGDGVANSISGTSMYYAGGGGGGYADAGGTVGAGGLGGGGAGGLTAGVAGTPNTGGGGGGSTRVGGGKPGGAGGSGVVVVAYNNPDPYWRNVVLLAGNNNGTASSTTFTDQSLSKHALTPAGNAQWDALYAPTGAGSSILFDGSGDTLQLDGSTDFAFGTNDFTIEFEVRLNATGIQQILYDSRPPSTQGTYPTIYINTDNTINFFQSSANRITGSALTTGQWYHIALTRSGTNTKLFINGTQTGSTYTDSNSYLNGSGRPFVSAHGYFDGGSNLNGWMSNIRVTKGVARYTSNFTPPTLGLPVTVSSSTIKPLPITSAAPPMMTATGGTITTVTDKGINYKVHTFTTSGTFTVTKGSGKVWYLVVAGGGGSSRGGGGGGGLRTNSGYGYQVNPGTYTVTVGDGGTAGSSGVKGGNGNNSVFDTITATGGGGGGANDVSGAGLDGGSGGGAGASAGSTMSGGSASPSGQGNAGGTNGGPSSSPYPSGGGGGAGAAGSSGNGVSTSGNGGAGLASTISGSSVTYAGGGGGASYNGGGTAGTGGAGGGGAGTEGAGVGTAGTANTGGGGGGNGHAANNGAAGGSGVVIIRYPIWTSTANASQNAKVTNGLVGLWSFDNPDMAGVTAYDRSGSGNNGTLTNGPTRTAGKIGQGLSFNGTNQYVDAGTTIGNFENTDSFSVSAWVNTSTLDGANHGIVDRVTPDTGWQLRLTTGNKFRFIVLSTGANYNGEDSGSLTTRTWYHVVGTWNGSDSRIFVNGVESFSPQIGGTVGTITGVRSLRVGYEGEFGTYFNGSIDDVRIYNRALSPAEVKQLYNQGR